MGSTGCFGSVLRLVLGIKNFLMLLIGIGIFVSAALLRWGPDSFFNKIVTNSNDDLIAPIINVLSINSVTIGLLVIGSFVIVLSICGLIGAICANKFFLILYEVVLVLIFLAHLIALILVSLVSSDIEKSFKTQLNNTVYDLNTLPSDSDDATIKCSEMKILSGLFECCGYNGPSDFTKNKTYVEECCVGMGLEGCANKTIKAVKGDFSIIIASNSTLIGLEFLLVILVVVLISLVTSRKNRRNNEERQMLVNTKPANYYSNVYVAPTTENTANRY